MPPRRRTPDGVAQAREALEQAQDLLAIREAACEKLPSQEDAEKKLKELRAFRDEWNALQMENQMLPRAPLPPAKKDPFADHGRNGGHGNGQR